MLLSRPKTGTEERMDPFSIVVGTVALVVAVSETIRKIDQLYSSFRHVASEFEEAKENFQELQEVVKLIEDVRHANRGAPSHAEALLSHHAEKCSTLMAKFNKLLDAHRGRWDWITSEKAAMVNLTRQLKDQIDGLKFTHDIMTK